MCTKIALQEYCMSPVCLMICATAHAAGCWLLSRWTRVHLGSYVTLCIGTHYSSPQQIPVSGSLISDVTLDYD